MCVLDYPVRYEGVVLVVRVRPVPVGHHGAEPLLQAGHGPRLVEVRLRQRNVTNKLLEHGLLLIHAPNLAPVIVLVTLVDSGRPKKIKDNTYISSDITFQHGRRSC